MTPSEAPGAALLTQTVTALQDELIAFRRDLHAHPELSHAETRSTRRVAARLRTAGVSVRLLSGTGLIGDLGPPQPAYRVALRADLDALPVAESTAASFASGPKGSAMPAVMTSTRRRCWAPDWLCRGRLTSLLHEGLACA